MASISFLMVCLGIPAIAVIWCALLYRETRRANRFRRILRHSEGLEP